jgi:hypothetical protein
MTCSIRMAFRRIAWQKKDGKGYERTSAPAKATPCIGTRSIERKDSTTVIAVETEVSTAASTYGKC